MKRLFCILVVLCFLLTGTFAQDEGITILPNGNVGIGTTTPDAALEVDGDVEMSGTLEVDGGIQLENDDSSDAIKIIDITNNNLFTLGHNDTNALLNTSQQMQFNVGGETVFDLSPKGEHWVGRFFNNNGSVVYLANSSGHGIHVANSNPDPNGYLIHLAGLGVSRFKVYNDGRVYINGGIHVNGIIESDELIIKNVTWADFVFDDDYELMSLDKVKQFILENGHLPEIPSGKEIIETGVDIGTMNAKLLQKIGELTLYVIELKEDTIKLRNENMELKQRISNVEDIID